MLKASILSDRYASGRTLTVGYESLWGSGCYSTKSIAQYKDLSVCLRNVTPAIQEAFLAYLSTYDPQMLQEYSMHYGKTSFRLLHKSFSNDHQSDTAVRVMCQSQQVLAVSSTRISLSQELKACATVSASSAGHRITSMRLISSCTATARVLAAANKKIAAAYMIQQLD
eukprot:6726-Heterococcus_DN1.PRE.1